MSKYLTAVYRVQAGDSVEQLTKDACRMSWSDAMTERDELRAEVKRLVQEEDALHVLTAKLSALLTGVVNSVRGEPPPLKSWSGHDAPELVRGVVQEIEQLRAALEELVDLQNGPPLHKYTTDWYKAMVEASKLLSRPESVAFYRQKLGKEVAKAGGDDE